MSSDFTKKDIRDLQKMLNFPFAGSGPVPATTTTAELYLHYIHKLVSPHFLPPELSCHLIIELKSDFNYGSTLYSFMQFISFQNQRVLTGQISPGTIANYYKATKLFIEMNTDTPIINWKRISRGLPKGRKAANDRAPTLEELRKLSEYPNRRIKPIIHTMASSGIRIGAWDFLQWKHISPVKNEKHETIAARLIVYSGDPEEYYCFITPEAYDSIQKWMDYRAEHGEKVSGDSWLMRDLWQTTDMKYGAMFGVATYPKRLKSSGIKSLLERAIKAQGLCKPLPSGVTRREWKGAHGNRKYYKTRAEQVMKPANVELTMGHDIGVSESYYKPTEREILDDYLKAIDILTIDNDTLTLQKHVAELTQRSEEESYVIKGKLSEKEQTILAMKEKYDSDIALLKEAIADMQQLLKNPHKLGEIPQS